MPRHLLARREPNAGQRLHLRNQPIQHGDAQRAARNERVHHYVEVTTLAILLPKRIPPQVKYSLRISYALRLRCALPNHAKLKNIASSIA